MDEKDRLLLACLENGLSFVSHPFDIWASKTGMDSAEVLVRIQRLKNEGLSGGIEAVLDPRALRYPSAWGAVRVGVGEGATRAEAFWRHPGVVYGCEREGEFNVWFRIAVPPGHDLEAHVRCLEALAGAKVLFLPVGKVFKGTDLLSALDAPAFPVLYERFEKQKPATSSDLTEGEITMLRKLQEPFPLTDEPYRKIAAELGITEAEALERISSLAKRGCLKRIGGSFRNSVSSSGEEKLVVWQIPEEKLEKIGPEITGYKEVLYADRRPAFPEFPYSFSMVVRAGTPVELEVLIRRIQDRIGKWPYRELVTVRVLKKERMVYFPGALDAWWRENRHAGEEAFH